MRGPSDDRRAAQQRAPSGWVGIATATLCATAIGITWPLARTPATAIPLGTEHEATVPLFSLWTLWWAGDRAAHGFNHYWEAPFFHPQPDVFTFSEPMSLPGALSAPLWIANTPPALVYNLILLAILVLNGLFTYRLVRSLDVQRPFALLAGTLGVALPIMSKQLGVLPILPIFGILWTLEGLVRFSRSGNGRSAAWAVAGFLCQYLCSQQLAVMFAPFALVAGAVALAHHGRSLRAYLKIGAVAAIGAIILAALVAPVWQAHQRLGFSRSAAVVQAMSAHAVDLITRPATATLSIPLRDNALEGDTGGLFPGILLSLLAGAGALAGLLDSRTRMWTAFLTLSAVVAFLLSLGLNVELSGWQPYAALREFLPGLLELRSVFRFAVLAQALLPVLAALAISRAAHSMKAPWGLGAVAIVSVLAAVENLSIPQPLLRVPYSSRAPWSDWLRQQPASTVVAHIPLPAGLHVSDYEPDAWRMFAQINHRQRIINGYSSYFPPGYGRYQAQLAQRFPEYAVLCSMKDRLGVNTLVIDRDWFDAHQEEFALESVHALLVPLYADPEVRIFGLAPPAGACVAGP